MEYIWTSEQIEKLLQNPSEDVQYWAINQAFQLYPDALGNRILNLIPSSDDHMVKLILNLAIEVNLPISNVEPLLALSKDETRSECSPLAGAILIRSGCELLPDDIAFKSAVALPGLACVEKKGFDLLLRYFGGPDSEKAPVMRGIAQACSFSDLLGEMEESGNPKSLNKRLNYFRNLLKCDIPHLERLHRPEEILTALDYALAKATPAGEPAWKQGLLNELETDRIKLGKVREIAAARISGWSSEDKLFLLAAILCLRRNEACGRSLVEASDAAGLWKAVTLKPWWDAPGQELKEFLLSIEPDELLNSLSQSLRQEYAYGSYGFSLLNTLDTPGRLEFFLDIFEGNKQGDVLAEEAGTALHRAGLKAVELIIQNYPQLSEDLRALGLLILDSFPVPQVVDFGLKHFDEYLLSQTPADFVVFLERIGSEQFLVPLLREWKEGEVEISRAIKLISEINGIRNDRIDLVIQDFEKTKRNPEEAFDIPLTLYPLRCTQCGHTYNYELKLIYIDKQKDFIIGDVIQCKGCGALQTYEITHETQWKVMAELTRVAIFAKEHPEKDVDSLDTPLIVTERAQMENGQNTNDVCEAYHIFQDELKKHPQDAVLHRRMGNLLINGGRDDLAFPYYLEAVRLNPLEVESLCSIVDIFVEQERYQEAFPYLDMLVPAIQGNRMNEDMRLKMFGVFIEQAQFIEQKTGHRVELFPMIKQEGIKQAGEAVWAKLADPDLYTVADIEFLYQVIRYGKAPKKATEADHLLEAADSDQETRQMPIVLEKKAGRNDPCPCGSGKKYKKCCGR